MYRCSKIENIFRPVHENLKVETEKFQTILSAGSTQHEENNTRWKMIVYIYLFMHLVLYFTLYKSMITNRFFNNRTNRTERQNHSRVKVTTS